MPDINTYTPSWAAQPCDLTFELQDGPLNGTKIVFALFQNILNATIASADQGFLYNNVSGFLFDPPAGLFSSNFQIQYDCADTMRACCPGICPSVDVSAFFIDTCMPGEDHAVVASPVTLSNTEGLALLLLPSMCSALASVAYQLLDAASAAADAGDGVGVAHFVRNHIYGVMHKLLADTPYWPSEKSFLLSPKSVARSAMFFSSEAPITSCNTTVVLQDQSADLDATQHAMLTMLFVTVAVATVGVLALSGFAEQDQQAGAANNRIEPVAEADANASAEGGRTSDVDDAANQTRDDVAAPAL